MFSTVISAFFSISLTSSSPRGDLRLIANDFLLALNMWKYHGSSSGLPGRSRRPGSPVFGFSILTTSAPSQASASVQDVPASNWVKSTTRMPARHSRSWQFSLITDLLPRLARWYSKLFDLEAAFGTFHNRDPVNSSRRFHGPHPARHERSDRRERKARVRRVHAEPGESAQHRPVFAPPAHARDGAKAGSSADL